MTNRPRTFTGGEARRLLRRARTGTLATLSREGGIPYASLVNVATDVEGQPLILISKLAWHTKNLEADPRASLMAAEPPADGDALTGPRVTVMGHFKKVSEDRVHRRYLARHPEAAMYVDFPDFAFWRMVPELVHAVAGFGRIETLGQDEVFPPAPEITEIGTGAIFHMNEDHAEAVRLYATKLLGAPDGKWKVAAIDPDGADLVYDGRSLRLAFDEPVSTGNAIRRTLAGLSAKARRPTEP